MQLILILSLMKTLYYICTYFTLTFTKTLFFLFKFITTLYQFKNTLKKKKQQQKTKQKTLIGKNFVCYIISVFYFRFIYIILV